MRLLRVTFSAFFAIPVQLDGQLLTPSAQPGGCSAPCWLRSSRARPPHLHLSPRASGLRWPHGCPSASPRCRHPLLAVTGWSGNGAEPGADIQGQTSRGSSPDGLWALVAFGLICRQAKPAVIGGCRWTAVLLIACINKRKMEGNIQPSRHR